MKIVVYTCITDGYDEVLEPAVRPVDVDFVCFTDRLLDRESAWTFRPLPRQTRDPAADNRFAKMFPHKLFPDHDVSIYIDGNIRVVGDVRSLVDSERANGDIHLYEHPFRTCAYKEAEACGEIGHDWWWRIDRQMDSYRHEGFPSDGGLFEANVIIRRHNSPAVQKVMDLWWCTYSEGVRRDQLSLPYVAWKLNVPIISMGRSDQRFDHKYFSLVVLHKKSLPPLTRIRRRINRMVYRARKAFGNAHAITD